MRRFVIGATLLVVASIWGPTHSAGDYSQSLVAQPQPVTPPAQINAVTDRDYLLSIIAERDRQYSQRFDYQEKAVLTALIAAKEAVAAALAAAKEAVAKAEAASEKRFEGINEFRAQLKDQQQTFIPRTEVTAAIKLLSDQLSVLISTQVPRAEYTQAHKQLADQITDIGGRQVPRSELETHWAAETLIINAIQNKLDTISNRQYTAAGQSEGSSSLWGFIAGGLGLLIAIGALVMAWSQRPKGT